MYEGYAKKLYESRNTLERFILRKHDNELSEETYKAFIINLLEERKQRQGDTLDEEFGTFDLDNWHGKKKHAEEFGKEVTSWFEDMTRQISEKTAENFKKDIGDRGKRRIIPGTAGRDRATEAAHPVGTNNKERRVTMKIEPFPGKLEKQLVKCKRSAGVEDRADG